ncbi:MAG: mechanosensitive ion channel [Candidatus Latescibacteria bacterium]|jgi:MscS family membrane protein|nr:mechanosensitive ion channel [Candidatus Latescibacterota bacterium]
MDIYIKELSKLPAVLSFIIQISIIILLSFVLRWFWKNVLIRIAKKTATTLDRRIFEATGKPAQLTFIAAGLQLSWNLYGEAIIKNLGVISWVNTGVIQNIISNLCFLFFTLSIISLVWKMVFATMEWFEKDVAAKTTTTLDEKIVFSLRKLVKVALIVISAMIIAEHFNLPFSKLWAAAGIGSLAVALAAKDTFANIISGVNILFDRPFLVGDRIELADGTLGDVVDIGLRSTKILSFDHTIYILPNAEISNQRIANHTYPDMKLKVALKLGVAYGSDMEKVKQILNEILKAHPNVLDNPPWGIWFTEFGDSSLDLFIRFWIRNYKDKFDIKDEINMEIKQSFEKENIEIPFPQREVHILQPNNDKGE